MSRIIPDEQRSRLLELAVQMRLVAEPVGSVHGWWDCIFDLEAIAKGESGMITEWTTERYIAEAEYRIAHLLWQRAARLALRFGISYTRPEPLSPLFS